MLQNIYENLKELMKALTVQDGVHNGRFPSLRSSGCKHSNKEPGIWGAHEPCKRMTEMPSTQLGLFAKTVDLQVAPQPKGCLAPSKLPTGASQLRNCTSVGTALRTLGQHRSCNPLDSWDPA